ncbi:hypothetical protein AK812_SmicGene27525 [Symbiodinium microadriaticum]|uniref:Uncharacterized protein n=1 Tax=Symbiodinium microadriaticum TaxID=2951 RepID=A0A1Q9D6M9_SYMMI|nr:hypothetical protein AK812_SmicGene27525 [Symbiodinium microadriaticum]
MRWTSELAFELWVEAGVALTCCASPGLVLTGRALMSEKPGMWTGIGLTDKGPIPLAKYQGNDVGRTGLAAEVKETVKGKETLGDGPGVVLLRLTHRRSSALAVITESRSLGMDGIIPIEARFHVIHATMPITSPLLRMLKQGTWDIGYQVPSGYFVYTVCLDVAIYLCDGQETGRPLKGLAGHFCPGFHSAWILPQLFGRTFLQLTLSCAIVSLALRRYTTHAASADTAGTAPKKRTTYCTESTLAPCAPIGPSAVRAKRRCRPAQGEDLLVLLNDEKCTFTAAGTLACAQSRATRMGRTRTRRGELVEVPPTVASARLDPFGGVTEAAVTLANASVGTGPHDMTFIVKLPNVRMAVSQEAAGLGVPAAPHLGAEHNQRRGFGGLQAKTGAPGRAATCRAGPASASPVPPSIFCRVVHMASSCPRAKAADAEEGMVRMAWLARGEAQGSKSSHAHWRSGSLGSWQLVEQPFLGPCLDEGRVPQQRTKDNYASLGIRLVASPDIITKFRDPRRSEASFGCDDPGLAQVRSDVTLVLNSALKHTITCAVCKLPASLASGI